MFVHLSIHHPKPGKESPLIDSMHRFGVAMQGQAGLHDVQTLKGKNSGVLIGLALWDSQQSMLDARPAMAEAVKDDPFEEWEDGEPEVYLLETV